MKIKYLLFILLLGFSNLISADEFTDNLAIIEAAYGPVEEWAAGEMPFVPYDLIIRSIAQHESNDVEVAVSNIKEAIELLNLGTP